MDKPVEKPESIGNLGSRLRAMAQGRDTLDVARFQFIDLDAISAAYGERWPQNKRRIEGVAEGFLRRRMDAGDLLIKADEGFLVVFGSTAGVAVDAAVGALSHGLNEFFLGEVGEVPAPRFSATSHSAPVTDLAASLRDADFHAADAPDVPSLPNVEWRYQPVWDVRHETLSSWYLTPYSNLTAQRIPGYQFENVAASVAQYAAMDEASLLASEQDLKDLISKGKRVLIGASIHARTMSNFSSRARLLAIIDRLDPELFRYRVLKIAGVAPGFPRLYLDEIVGLLRARIRNVVIGAAWDEPDLAGLLHAGAVAVGVTLPRSVLGPTAAVPSDVLIRKLKADLQAAHAARVRYFVEGQIDAQLVSSLAAVGIDNIASPVVWPAGDLPDGMLKWPLRRLVA